MSLASVRLCTSSILEFFWDLYPNSLRGTPKEDSAKPASFSYRAGDLNRRGAPGEARVKERNSCGHSLYSQTFLGDCIMSKERPKRNIIQKKYVSKDSPLPYLLSNAMALFKFALLVSMKMHKLSSRTAKVTIRQPVHYLGQIFYKR